MIKKPIDIETLGLTEEDVEEFGKAFLKNVNKELGIDEIEAWEPSKLQSIIWSALMDAKYTNKDMGEILDDTTEWLSDEFFMQEYDSSTSTKMGDEDE